MIIGGQGFNLTIVELKYPSYILLPILQLRFNLTIVELKLKKLLQAIELALDLI